MYILHVGLKPAGGVCIRCRWLLLSIKDVVPRPAWLLDRSVELEGRSSDRRHHVAGDGAVAAEGSPGQVPSVRSNYRLRGQVPSACRHSPGEAVRRLLGHNERNVPAAVLAARSLTIT